jgi:MerR family redox-sensitive transcriptional activator SoxR
MERDQELQFTIGALSDRTGVAPSAIRFYESKGLLESTRSSGGQRRYARSDVRRVSFILIAQRLGFPLRTIAESLASLPGGRTPTKRDWESLSRKFHVEIEERIRGLTALRERLSSCIGCGCLSLKSCHIYNPEDGAEALGTGPRFLLGDSPDDV